MPPLQTRRRWQARSTGIAGFYLHPSVPFLGGRRNTDSVPQTTYETALSRGIIWPPTLTIRSFRSSIVGCMEATGPRRTLLLEGHRFTVLGFPALPLWGMGKTRLQWDNPQSTWYFPGFIIWALQGLQVFERKHAMAVYKSGKEPVQRRQAQHVPERDAAVESHKQRKSTQCKGGVCQVTWKPQRPASAA